MNLEWEVVNKEIQRIQKRPISKLDERHFSKNTKKLIKEFIKEFIKVPKTEINSEYECFLLDKRGDINYLLNQGEWE